jgi:molybdopterin converting factor small subunit
VARVHLLGALSAHTGGIDRVDIDAVRVHELILALTERFPGLAEPIRGMAIAIDGEIYNDAPYHALRDDSEIYFVPPVAGG